MSKNNIIIAIVSALVIVMAVLPAFMAQNVDINSTMKEWIPQAVEAESFSEVYFGLLRDRDLETARKFFDPDLLDKKFERNFDVLVRLVPEETPKSIKIIGAQSRTTGGTTIVSISSEYEFSNRWLLTSVTLQKQNDSFVIKSVNVQPLAVSLEQLSRFGFTGKSLKHYSVIAVAAMLLLFSLYAFALCMKTPIPKRKWLWAIFILAGVSMVNFSWTSGAFHFQPFVLRLPVAWISQMPYQPPFVAMTIPLGAVVFMFKRKKWLA